MKPLNALKSHRMPLWCVPERCEKGDDIASMYRKIGQASIGVSWILKIETSISAYPRRSCVEKSHCLKVSRVEMSSVSVNNLMLAFFNWMTHRDAVARLRLLETSAFFNPVEYNAVFDGELEKALARLPESEAKRQAMELRVFDWGSFISRSLRKMGFQDDDEQEVFQSIVVKLLISPGRLFKGWQPEKHGALIARFRRSVKNAIINLAEKNHNFRRRLMPTDPTMMASMYAGRQPQSNLIAQFRDLVKERLGNLALAIFDQRLQGEDTKNLVGKEEFGTPSAFYVKKAVRAIKELADGFAARHGDSDFSNLLATAMKTQAEIIAKRQRAMAAKSA